MSENNMRSEFTQKTSTNYDFNFEEIDLDDEEQDFVKEDSSKTD